MSTIEQKQQFGGAKLNGEWLCKDTENFDSFLTVLGVGWLQRKAAKAFLYGKNSQTLSLKISENNVEEISKGRQTLRSAYKIGAAKQTMSTAGGIVPVEAKWQDNNLVLETEMHGKEVVIVRSLVEANKMVVSITECASGINARRIFTKLE